MKHNIIKNLLQSHVISEQDIENYYNIYYSNINISQKKNSEILDNKNLSISQNPISILIKLDYICEEDIKDDIIYYYENYIKSQTTAL